MKRTTKIKGYKSIEVGGLAWQLREAELLRNFIPTRECGLCGNPVAKMYKCYFCGGDDSDVDNT